MDSFRHRGKPQYCETSTEPLATISRSPICIPGDIDSTEITKIDTDVENKIRRSRSLIHERYRTSFQSSFQTYHTAPLISNRNFAEFEMDHIIVHHKSTPLENNHFDTLHVRKLLLKGKEVRNILGTLAQYFTF